ncbi:MAG: phage terminase small subunit [Salinisphaeraceae bacterium]
MTSPARRSRERKLAARAADSPAAAARANDQQDLMLAALWNARQTLKDIRATERKVEAKRELLPQFFAYVDGVLEADTGEQDEVLMTVMLWHLDIGDVGGALRIADYAMHHGLTPPDRFQRDTATLVAEQAAEELLTKLEALPESAADQEEAAACAAEYLAQLEHAHALTAEADMHDQARAKLHKALGYAHRATGEHDQEALEHLKRAVELNSKIGVKKDIERLERQVKNAGSGA